MQHHFLFSQNQIKRNFKCRKRSKSTTTKESGVTLQMFSKRMDKLISRYNQSHTKENNRHSALIESSFKRLEIDSDDYQKPDSLYSFKSK
jgi:hypothetical protein